MASIEMNNKIPMTGNFIVDFRNFMKALDPNKEIMDKMREENVSEDIIDKLYCCDPPKILRILLKLDKFDDKILFLRQCLKQILIYDKNNNVNGKKFLTVGLEGMIEYLKYKLSTNNLDGIYDNNLEVLNSLQSGLTVINEYDSFTNEFGQELFELELLELQEIFDSQ